MPIDDEAFFRKRPQQSRSRSVVNAILEAADELLSSSGDPERLSLQGIARRAGVGIGSLYDYFPNREKLLGAFLSKLTEHNYKAIEAQLDSMRDEPFDEALPKFVDATMTLYLSHPRRTRAAVLALARLGLVSPAATDRDRVAALIARRVCETFPGVEYERARLSLEVICDSVIGVIVGELWRTRTPEQQATVRAEVTSLVREGIARLRTQDASSRRAKP